MAFNFFKKCLLITNCLILCTLILRLNLGASTFSISSDFHKINNDTYYFNMDRPYRAWQGVVTDGNNFYVTTDRSNNFKLDDIIEKYSLNGNILATDTNAYNVKDPSGKFMSFGSPEIIGNQLYVTTYDCNGGGSKPYVSRVATYNLSNLKLTHDYSIGSDVAECIQIHDGYYWVCYDDAMIIKKFSLNFRLLADYRLPQKMKAYGGYQGIVWDGNDIYLNWHGPNSLSQLYIGGLDEYSFNGNSFKFLKEFRPPTLGCGQSVSKYGEYWIWNDRPMNRVILSENP